MMFYMIHSFTTIYFNRQQFANINSFPCKQRLPIAKDESMTINEIKHKSRTDLNAKTE